MLVSVFKDGVIQLNMAEQCEVLDSFFLPVLVFMWVSASGVST